jgi:glycosyltransferase involved in cell wall biosynthesis
MKIHILYKTQQSAWGGGNQFIKALKEYLIEHDYYEQSLYSADIILVNSHQHLLRAAFLKLFYPNKTFIHRIDGPINIARKHGQLLDSYISMHNKIYFDGTIFQSPWSKEQCFKSGYIDNGVSTVIINASDNNIFNHRRLNSSSSLKIKLISTSWSTNATKGFSIYSYLDSNLNYDNYEYLFIGNSPIKFKNIKYIPAVDSDKLAEYLNNSDIYITASKNDPCSNSLIEALTVGLPSVALNSGGHPFIIGTNNGELFESERDVVQVIDKVSQSLDTYKRSVHTDDIDAVSLKYYRFIENLYHIKKIKTIISIKSMIMILSRHIYLKITRNI